MTAYTTHPDSIFEVGKPNLGSTHSEARDNLIAVAAGHSTAPRVYIGAFERLTAGTVEKWKRPAAIQATNTSEFETSLEFGLIQGGTVSVAYNHRQESGSGSQQAKVVRRRMVDSGSGATLVEDDFLPSTSTSATNVTLSGDITVLPGDALVFQQFASSTGVSEISDLTLKTNGEDIYPVSNHGYYVNLRTLG